MFPLFAPVPGGPELLIVLFTLLMFVVAPIAVVALIFWLLRGRDVGGGAKSRDDDTDLERRVNVLEDRVDNLESDADDGERWR